METSCILGNNQWIIEEVKEEMKKYLETNENENMTIQNLWDAAKAVLRGKFTSTTPRLGSKKAPKETIWRWRQSKQSGKT